jgi:hypothetical protein
MEDGASLVANHENRAFRSNANFITSIQDATIVLAPGKVTPLVVLVPFSGPTPSETFGCNQRALRLLGRVGVENGRRLRSSHRLGARRALSRRHEPQAVR